MPEEKVTRYRTQALYGKRFLSREASGALDAWGEHLYFKRQRNRTVTLSVVGREVLADGREGRRLVPYDDYSVATFVPGELGEALTWLSDGEWDREPGFEMLKRVLTAALEV